MDATSDFKFKILSRKRSPDEYRIYQAALEWDLTDPIVIESQDDFKSTYRWQDRLTPYLHQVSNLITFCRRLPVTLLADDVGLGKTVSAGLIISELLARSRIAKILIVCPKILAQQWKEEFESKFNIPATIAFGRDLIDAEPDEIGAVITTYNSARLHLEKIPEDRFQMLVLDEAHKLRNLYGVQKTPEVAKRFRKALEDRRFPFVLMLTATPIQNRLWDLYSLVDLLTVARGHDNPFGTPGMFARHFIADNRDTARELKAEARDEFRSIVYGYMSRVRRGDANLYFPERKVFRHEVNPTAAELRIIETIAKPIQKLNKLTQISILLALTSSPQALSAQLTNMARKGTAPIDLAASVKAIVDDMPLSAKLIGLSNLIETLKKENPNRWRLVVFTIRRETQTTIQNFLERRGFKVGIINGDSGERNQEAINRFRANPPAHRIIVSTEAGSEGVNLQVANVLVNYDLPWNPMIVEQRIGRVQRLASDHAHVSIYNVTLRGTFEDFIVGRLMEKLQMAAHAVGDVEALLQGADVGDGDEDVGTSFEEQILKLVLAALAGKDVAKATRLAEKSIEDAKVELEREEKNIGDMLGGMDGAEYDGPRTPDLPAPHRSLDPQNFTLDALKLMGAKLTPSDDNLVLAEEVGKREYIRFNDQIDSSIRSTLYAPGTPPFQRLVSRLVASGVHDVEDIDLEPNRTSEEVISTWASGFGAKFSSVEVDEVSRAFDGAAIVRVRATVAHDSYERLVTVPCSSRDHRIAAGKGGLAPIPRTIEKPEALGIDTEKLRNSAIVDEGIAEFSRFYLERRELETERTADERKRRKLQDEFTPNLDMMLVGAHGKLRRELKVRAKYSFDGEDEYESIVTISPSSQAVLSAPGFGLCSKSGKTVPSSCLSKCQITGAEALRHLLVKSELSGRLALPEFATRCAQSGLLLLRDEAELSDITGELVSSHLLKTSALSGKKAEAAYFDTCAFTHAELLKEELAVSDVSGKNYRADQQARSVVSGRAGHRQEFVICHETRQPLVEDEAEKCEITGHPVRIGVLERCEISEKRVLPIGLERCAVSGRRALKRFLVDSSISGTRFLNVIAIQSKTGLFCTPSEAASCIWSNRKAHPNDIRKCQLTGLPVHLDYLTSNSPYQLSPLIELLSGVKHNADKTDQWTRAADRLAASTKGGKYTVESAVLSPSGQHLATCSELRAMLGLRTYHVGSLYELASQSIVGRISKGRRGKGGWIEVAG
jgi:superfamily II DNA or RNA helicase